MNPSDTDTRTREAPPGCHRAGFDPETETWPRDDRGLMDQAVALRVWENRCRARRMEAVSRFHARRLAEFEGHGSGRPGFFVLTPLEATKAEFAPLLCMGEGWVESDLDAAIDLMRWFPGAWAQCLAGRLDVGRACVLRDQLANLTCDEDKAAYAKLMEDYLDSQDDPRASIHPADRRSLQRASRRKCLRFPQKTAEETFAEAFKKRRVSLRTDDNGMAHLGCSTSVTDAIAADYRLTLIARKRREQPGEERTIEQLRADTLIDLVHGRLEVGSTDGSLEDDELPDGGDPATAFEWKDSIGSFARPIINVTVPITTLIGLSNESGVLAGGGLVPADLLRQIAKDPRSTWYRMLTDAAGGFVALSTNSYSPTGPIWRCVVARDRECVWPGCSRPSTVVELDHREPFPKGRTSTSNLQPLCERHHKVKHSEGFKVMRESDGSYSWTSRFGSRLRTPRPECPIAVWPSHGGVETDVEDELDLAVEDVGSVVEVELRAWMEEAVVGS